MVFKFLSYDARNALENLEVVLDVENPSMVVEFLILEAWEKYLIFFAL
ncbi:MAG: hypothetical protein GY710_08730 [Desulfobacteraceae bacterium]|nr:hypothetical protein [Desulfobacteraceae bacterium]